MHVYLGLCFEDLRGLNTHFSRFATGFNKGDNFYDYLSASLLTNLMKRGLWLPAAILDAGYSACKLQKIL